MASDLHVIVGLGATGLSCARFLKSRGVRIAVMDTRAEPPFLSSLKKDFPEVPLVLGKLDEKLLNQAAAIVLSPGIALREPLIAEQVKKGKPIIGDIELFATATKTPIVAITGTNAKSTVTTLVGKMAEAAGLNVKVGGNLGVPALDLLNHPSTDLFVLELSSFQLETTYSLRAQVATVLNITPDHMDRYSDLAEYQATKHRIYQDCKIAICNKDDPLTETNQATQNKFYFTLKSPYKKEFGLVIKNNETYLAYEDKLLMPIREIPVAGKHYLANALASLAIGKGMNLPMDAMLKVLRDFKGLPHRCQLVRHYQQVDWYNDSKGTNVGATEAAIEGLGSVISGKLILIMGGKGKNADFAPLLPLLEKYSRHIVLIGEAAADLERMLDKRLPYSFAASMEEAVQQAAKVAKPNDSVLLSPACASYDMFKNFEHRGEVFMEKVNQLTLIKEPS